MTFYIQICPNKVITIPLRNGQKREGANTVFHQLGCFIGTPVATTILMLAGSQNPMDCVMPASICLVVMGVLYCILAASTKMEKYGENYGKSSVD